MKTPVVLLVDDEDSIITSLRGGLEDEGYVVLTAHDGNNALQSIQSQTVDVVFLDIWLPGMDGMETLKAIKDFDTNIAVVMMTGHGTVNTAVQAVKQGAFDFLEKPFSLDTVIDIIKKIKEKTPTLKNNAGTIKERKHILTGKSPAVLKTMDFIARAADSNDNIFIQGETGTGKELIARTIHSKSKRKSGILEKFNCALFSSNELEAELFGLQKNKSSASEKKGIIGNLTNKTIYLDAIDLLPVNVQKKLSILIKDSNEQLSKTRIIAASIRDLNKPVPDGTFHKSLLGCFPLKTNISPLRSRRIDIPVLFSFFLEYFCADYAFRLKNLDDDALETLLNYDWPGNIKELKNMAEKLVVSVPTRNISLHDIPLSVRDEMRYCISPYFEKLDHMEDAEAAWRKGYILHHLRKNNRDIIKTAANLAIKEKTLKKYIKDYDIVLREENKQTKKFQRTLKRSMVMSGRGLHSGDKTGLIITPLPPDSGIIFGNISTGKTVPAHIDYVHSTDYATSLENNNAVARTIEHFLAVLHAYGINNLMIKINNEVPIMDGSSSDFCRIIEDAGIEEQDTLIEELVVTEKYSIGKPSIKNKYITIEPSEKFIIHYTLNYPKPVGHQEYTFVLEDSDVFKKEIAPARTFGFLKDIDALEKKGLGGGGRLNNFILIDEEKIINTVLRFPDEFVRHKILDMLGDLYLLGRPIKGKITANMTGHSENISLVRLLREKLQL